MSKAIDWSRPVETCNGKECEVLGVVNDRHVVKWHNGDAEACAFVDDNGLGFSTMNREGRLTKTFRNRHERKSGWVVIRKSSSGSYYPVLGVFASREDAENVKDRTKALGGEFVAVTCVEWLE